MASSSFSAFSCLFLLASPFVFLSGVNSTSSTSSTSTFVEDTCKTIPDKETQKVCTEYVTALLQSEELPKDVKFDEKEFIEGFIFGTTTAGYEMLSKLGMQMIAMANEKEEMSLDMQNCINSYEAATNTTLVAYYSFRKKDYTKASSQLLQASNEVKNCDKPLEKEKDLLESHETFVQLAKLPVTFIDIYKNSTKESS